MEKKYDIKKRKKTILRILIVIFIFLIVYFIRIKYMKIKPDIVINTKILESTNKVELNNLKELSLWKNTLSKLNKEQIKIEVHYPGYKITLNNQELKKTNNLEIEIKKEKT